MSARGFTLIEMAVVLVIIGLLIGGVFVGREMLRASELQAILSEVDGYKQGIQSFRDRYDAMPGDFSGAESFWGSDASCPNTSWNEIPKAATCNGNADNRIAPYDRDAGTQAQAYEMFRAWQHLANAGGAPGQFVGTSGDSGSGQDARIGLNVPGSRARGAGFMLYYLTCNACGQYFAADYKHVIEVGARSGSAPEFANAPFLMPAEARSLDAKVDDGEAGTGKILAPSSQANCVSGTAYNASFNGEPPCSLVFITGF